MQYTDITTSNLRGVHTKLLLVHLKATRKAVGDTFELVKVARELQMDYVTARDACIELRHRGIIGGIDAETFTLLKPLMTEKPVPDEPTPKPKAKGPVPPDATIQKD